MQRALQIQTQLLRWKRLPLAAIALALLVLGLTLALTTTNLRATIRTQILNQDGEILQAVARLQQLEEETGDEWLGSWADPGEQFNLVLKIARLPGVLGIRLYTPAGAFTNSFPAYVPEQSLPAADLASLRTGHSASHFRSGQSLAAVDLVAELTSPEEPPREVPILEVNVPLFAKDQLRLLGVAQFIIDGQSIAAEYAQLDQRLVARALLEFSIAGGLMVFGLWFAFRRLQRVQAAMVRQTERLALANQELALAARTSAVGAVTSHLIHGLKNPLSGLRGFVQSHVAGQNVEGDADWRAALATTDRMQALIAGVVRVLEDQQSLGGYEVSLREVVEIITARLSPIARSAGVHFHARLSSDGMLGNRHANLAILVLENLIQNALQATPEGKLVRLEVHTSGENVSCEVHDQGPGFPPDLRASLFQPCRSTKAGGSGLGLAISRQLARNIGGEIDLVNSSSAGCVFRLALPLKLLLPAFQTAN